MRAKPMIAGLALATLALLSITSLQTQEATPAHAATIPSDDPCGSLASDTPPGFGEWEHVVLIVHENKTYNTVFGNGWAPYLTSLRDKCGSATNMNHLSEVSLANYIAMTSGSTGQPAMITSNRGVTTWPQGQVSLFELLGTEARELAEAMPSNCYLKGQDYFVINHTPLQYYTRIRNTLCPTQAVPLASTPDLSAKFTMIIPDKANDMHKSPITPTIESRVRRGDAWTADIMPKLTASPEYQAGKTAIIITWDEGNGRSSVIPFIVVSPYTPAGLVVNTRYDHYSLLKAVQEMLGVTPLLGHAADAGTVSIRSGFHLG